MFIVPLAYPLRRVAIQPGWTRSRLEAAAVADAPLRPAMDASEDDSHYTLSFDLPGLAREQVNVTIEGREVRVEASAANAPHGEVVRVLRRERRLPRFERRVDLDTDIDVATSQARFENGVLTLTLVKMPSVGAQKIEVR
jgi:HSP20 family protein